MVTSLASRVVLASSTSLRSSRSSLAATRASLPDQPVLYSFQELAAATNNFLAKRGSSDTFWRCSLRSRPAALFQLHPVTRGPHVWPSRHAPGEHALLSPSLRGGPRDRGGP